MNDIDAQVIQRQTDCLFVLVGSNPLPNYVAAKLLLKPGGKLYLVHSVQVAEIARRLIEVLGLSLGETAELLNVDEGLGSDVYRRIGYAINSIVSGKSVGINYTGGTKVMAVHAYQRVLDYEREKGRKIVYSYLDAYHLSLVFDEADGASIRVPVRDALDLRLFDDMTRLHGYEVSKNQESRIKPNHPEYAAKLAACFWGSVSKYYVLRPGRPVPKSCPPTEYHKWIDWVYGQRLGDENYILDLRSAESLEKLRQIPLPVDLCPGLIEVFPGCKTLGDVAGLISPNDIRELCLWLGGLWLEDLAFNAMIGIKEQFHIREAFRSIRLVPHSSRLTDPTRMQKPLEFEIDIAALRGYQLFVISCTTSINKRALKLKLFEAFVRAHQFGGDEARIAILCGALPYHQIYNRKSYPNLIQQEIEQEWDAFKKVRVYGIEDWINLTAVLKNWFETT